MAFAGTEILEVAATTPMGVASGGGKVWAIGSGQAALLNTSTGEALLYTCPGNRAFRQPASPPRGNM